MKVCPKCKLELDNSNFYKNRSTKDGLSYACKICSVKKKEHCSICNNLRVVYTRDGSGKPICLYCFRKNNSPTTICSNCNNNKFLVNLNPNLCLSCYEKKKRYRVCSLCNEVGIIKTKEGLCDKCYSTYEVPKKLCNFCGDIKSVAKYKDGKPMCYRCYDMQPERIIKRLGNNEREFVSSDIWLSIMRECDWKCCYCNEKLVDENRTIDHIIPVYFGGDTIWENLVACCRTCNGKKGTKNIKVWIDKINISKKKEKYILSKVGSYEEFKKAKVSA